MNRPWNFSAGPAVLPVPVLEQAAAEMLDWHGSGLSVMEMSHRGRHFSAIIEAAEADLRVLLGLDDRWAVLFMQGGGLAENAIVPLNLAARRPARRIDFVLSGSWSRKSELEARRYAATRVVADNREAAGGRKPGTWLPDLASLPLDASASYLHICGNETIDGIEFVDYPDLAALGAPELPLVVDASSHILSRPMSLEHAGLIYAGAQKNIGPAGLTLVLVKRELLGHALPECPSAFDYAQVDAAGSRYNTPPTYGIYIAGLVFRWLREQGGVQAIGERNRRKAAMLYAELDRGGLYISHVDPACRSLMNIPFFLRRPELESEFLAQAEQAGLVQLKGHKSVGGLRASLYNALPEQAVLDLVAFMREFERCHG